MAVFTAIQMINQRNQFLSSAIIKPRNDYGATAVGAASFQSKDAFKILEDGMILHSSEGYKRKTARLCQHLLPQYFPLKSLL